MYVLKCVAKYLLCHSGKASHKYKLGILTYYNNRNEFYIELKISKTVTDISKA